ncbi:proteasome activator complex subunit 4-like isoform X2 [Aricia agestis]|uniref:proteasome activator complex subunit 4-like isoform X2 n=1 Tax=Aricia agestis TaxID=91739 RepID=UPI001C202807|nr:proteasome activator complex subunit 4-like isoform X2 [Aricia agestis]
MLQDDEFEELVNTPERIKALGFKPQKEILTNHLTPYADKLDEESQVFLEQVKTNLAKSVMLREMKPACGVWTSRLMKYLRIYGFKFGKEDHISFVKLTYELLLIPDLEPNKINKFATLFLMLTRKKDLISPKELTLPWRPLYELGIKLFHKNSSALGLFHYHTSLESTYTMLVRSAQSYFELEATKEILEELLPRVNPWAADGEVITILATFIPVGLPLSLAAHGHELWFDKIMTLWDTCYNAHCGTSDLLSLFAGLAKRNPGAVDWTPHVPKMFMRFLHALNLPVSYKDMQYARNQPLGIKHMATWIACTINPDGVVLKHLRSFLGGIESYLHSANSGRWSFKLRDLLRKLTKEFLSRVRREREKNFKKHYPKTREDYKLRDEDITEFVSIVLEPTLQAVNNRSGTLDISVALQNLAILRPDIVVPPLVDRLKTSLTSLTEPHRVTAAMSAVGAVARPMLRGPHANYPEGPTHVVPLLMAVLPGLDPNDMKKTLVTLHFIFIFSDMIQFIDCSSAHEHWQDLTETELLVCESTAQFEDFILIFLDRLFVIIESSVHEQVRLDTKDTDLVRSKTDAVMETAISAAATSVLMQSSPKIFKEALRKFKAFATESTFETNVSGSMVGLLLRSFARVDAESTLAAFVPKLCEELQELVSTDEALKEENPSRDLVYRIVLLRNVVDCDGTVLLKYMPQILPVMDRILKLHSSYSLNRACKVLNQLFASLSRIDLNEWRSSSNDYNTAPEKWLPVREWGSGCMLKDANLKWHVPNAEEAACAQMLSDRYLKPEVERLKQWLSGERSMCRDRRLRCFHIINAVTSCSNFLPQPDDTPITFFESQVPATTFPLARGTPYSITLDGENMRVALTELLLKVQDRMLQDKTDDTKGLELLILAWERVVVTRMRASPGYETRLRSFGVLERSLEGRGGREAEGEGTARLRVVLADGARLQEDARLELMCDAGLPLTVHRALLALLDLAINTYSSVRVLAQLRIYWILNHYPYSYRALVDKVVDLISESGEGEEWHSRRKGALFLMLGPKAGPIVTKPDWEAVKALWPAVLKSPLSEKPSIIRLEQAITEAIHRCFMTMNTRLTMTQSAIDAAKLLLKEADRTDPVFTQQIAKAVDIEKAYSDRMENAYLDLVNEIVSVAESSNVQWRRLELAAQMLMFLPQPQTSFPARAVRLILRLLIHDDIAVRRAATNLTLYVLKQQKRKIKKVDADPYEIAGVTRPETPVPGYRKDLEWSMWHKDSETVTEEDWNKPWLRHPYYGFYAWPKTIKVTSPPSEQDLAIDLPREKMTEEEQHIFDFFSDEANVDKLVSFLTVEEKKGKDKFNGIRYIVFKMVFAHFGMRVAERFLRAAERHAALREEASQRFAAEITTAALTAPRHHPHRAATDMMDAALRTLTIGLNSVTPETMEEWGTCVATGVERLCPRRAAPALAALLRASAPRDTPDTDADGSFLICARLFALQGAFSSLSWRLAPLAAELLKTLEATDFIQHPYQNVRETVGSLLMTIFDTELTFPGGESGPNPRLKDFLASVIPKFAALYDENGDIVIASASLPGGGAGRAGVSGGVAGEVCGVAPPPRVHVAHLPAATNTDTTAPQTDEGEEEERSVCGAGAVGRGVCGAGGAGAGADKLSDRLHTALRLAGDASPCTHAHALNLLTTVLRCCLGLIIRAVNGNIETQYELLPIACALASRGAPQNEELPRAAGGFLGSLCLAHHSSAAFDRGLDVLENLADEKSWWARLACLDFAQPLLFYALPLLCDRPDRAIRAERFALKLMRDSRVEVRQSAAELLTGLMHCRALPDEDNTIKLFKRSCRSKELVERHCGVLGLCAYLSSRPYSIGPKLGNILAELAKHTSAPDPIPATIRKALADFRRTHQDDWPKHREQLTEEELDLLADLTAPPSYCA